MLEGIHRDNEIYCRVVAIDPNGSRRDKMNAVYAKIGGKDKQSFPFVVANIDQAKELISLWTGNAGCNAVLEVSQSYTRVWPN